MSRSALTPISYLVLGWLSFEPATPYELKRQSAQSVGYFWEFPHSQLYAEPARLTELGLLEEKRELGGRRRRVYSITQAGRKELEDWLREPTSEEPQIRDIGLLKLFFHDALDNGDVVALARAQEQAHRAKLAIYEELDSTIPEEAGFGRATLQAGLAFERAFIEFWSEIAAHPPAAFTRSGRREPDKTRKRAARE
ncbi:MAG: PadR family transcriptional regulator [Gaiellaceae bacterium]